MRKKFAIILYAFSFSVSALAQTENTSGQKQVTLINEKLLIGRWHSEIDAKYILVFQKSTFIELYARDTTANLNYKLSGSCKLKDSSTKVNMQKAFLIFYSKDGTVHDCNEIMNLKSSVLSWMNTASGKIFVFRKNR